MEKSFSNQSRPTLIIGLGGTGVNSIRRLKDKDDFPAHVRFLGIDTQVQDPRQDYAKLDINEFVCAQVDDPGSFVQLAHHRHIHDWWPQNLPTHKAIMDGAGQVRARGRLALFVNVQEISRAIEKHINEITQLTRLKEMPTARGNSLEMIDTYIVTSLCGGTGSGMFLDLALIVRHFLGQNLGQTRGIFVLPSAFERQPYTDWVASNAYAALMELDHLSSLDGTNSLDKINYSVNLKVNVNQPPYDRVYLVDDRNEQNNRIDKISTIHTLISDALHLLITSEISSKEKELYANIETTNKIRKARDKNLNYSSFGISYLKITSGDSNLQKEEIVDNLVSMIVNTEPTEEDFNSVLRVNQNLVREHNLTGKSALAVLEGGIQINTIGNFQLTGGMTEEYVRTRITEEIEAAGIQGKISAITNQLLSSFESDLKKSLNELLLGEAQGLKNCLTLCQELEAKIDSSFEIPSLRLMSHTGQGGTTKKQFNFAESNEEDPPVFLSPAWFRRTLNIGQNEEDDQDDVQEVTPQQRQFREDYIRSELYEYTSASTRKYLQGCLRIVQQQRVSIGQFLEKWEKIPERFDEIQLRRTRKGINQNRKPQESLFEISLTYTPSNVVSFHDFKDKISYNLDWASLRVEDLLSKVEDFVLIHVNQSSKTRDVQNDAIPSIASALEKLKNKDDDKLRKHIESATLLSVPLWSYSKSSIPINENLLGRIMHIGVPKDFEYECSIDWNDMLPPESSIDKPIPLGGRKDVIFMQNAVGLPAFAITTGKAWAEKYWRDSKDLESHIWENPWQIEDIYPVNEGHWLALGKGQAYGFIETWFGEPYDTIKRNPLIKGYENFRGTLFDLYSAFVFNPQNHIIQHVQAIIDLYENVIPPHEVLERAGLLGRNSGQQNDLNSDSLSQNGNHTNGNGYHGGGFDSSDSFARKMKEYRLKKSFEEEILEERRSVKIEDPTLLAEIAEERVKMKMALSQLPPDENLLQHEDWISQVLNRYLLRLYLKQLNRELEAVATTDKKIPTPVTRFYFTMYKIIKKELEKD